MHEMTFAACLGAALDEAGLTQGELAERVGIAPASVSRYMSGKRLPRIETVRKIADALGISVEVLCRDDAADELAESALLVCGHIADLTPGLRKSLVRSIAAYYDMIDRQRSALDVR